MLGHIVVLFLVFKGISVLSSIVVVSVCIPANSTRGFPFLHTLSSIYCLWIFDDGHSDWCEVMPHCSLDFLVLFVFQLLSHVRIFVTPWTAAHQPPLSFTISWSLPKLMAIVEKEMATHSSVLAWRISGWEEPGGLPSMGSHRVEHD